MAHPTSAKRINSVSGKIAKPVGGRKMVKMLDPTGPKLTQLVKNDTINRRAKRVKLVKW